MTEPVANIPDDVVLSLIARFYNAHGVEPYDDDLAMRGAEIHWMQLAMQEAISKIDDVEIVTQADREKRVEMGNIITEFMSAQTVRIEELETEVDELCAELAQAERERDAARLALQGLMGRNFAETTGGQA